jgi:hypothetical protein
VRVEEAPAADVDRAGEADEGAHGHSGRGEGALPRLLRVDARVEPAVDDAALRLAADRAGVGLSVVEAEGDRPRPGRRVGVGARLGGRGAVARGTVSVVARIGDRGRLERGGEGTDVEVVVEGSHDGQRRARRRRCRRPEGGADG